MSSPITVHQLSADGGRRVSVRTARQTHILGIAYSDRDVVEFMRRTGLEDAETLLDDPDWVRWQGGRPHQWVAA